jgi:hypothetical protein
MVRPPLLVVGLWIGLAVVLLIRLHRCERWPAHVRLYLINRRLLAKGAKIFQHAADIKVPN